MSNREIPISQSQQQQKPQEVVCNNPNCADNQCQFCQQGFQPTTYYQASPVRIVGQPQTTLISSQVLVQPQQSQVRQNIKGESRVEYYPIERREIEYKNVEEEVTENVDQYVIEYEEVERKYIERVPREVVKTEYQAVEYQKEYVPRVVYDTVQEQVPVERVEYVPVQRTEYVAQNKTEYITQSRQVERVEYDEVEYQVQRPQVQQQQQVYVSQVVQQPVQAVQASQRLQASQQLQQSQQQVPVQQVPVQYVQQPMYYSYVQPQQQPMTYSTYVPYQPQQLVQTAAPTTILNQNNDAQKAKQLVGQPEEKEKGWLERLFN